MQAAQPCTIQNQPMTQELNPKLTSHEDLVKILGLMRYKDLQSYSVCKREHYSVFRLPKKSKGNFRVIHNPDTWMRVVQVRILDRILNQVVLPDYLYAFEKGKSVIDMAREHVNKNYVISIDIKNYFPSIKTSHVKTIFTDLGFDSKPARLLSEICTYKNFLGQGLLTSPKLSNMVTAKTFGAECKRLADELGVSFTVYADDIVYSFNDKALISKLISKTKAILKTHGFKVNNQKVKVMSYARRQFVCGIVVNKKVNLWSKEYLKLRAIVHNITINGEEAESVKSNKTPAGFMRYVVGRLNWLKSINPEKADPLIDKLNYYLESN